MGMLPRVMVDIIMVDFSSHHYHLCHFYPDPDQNPDQENRLQIDFRNNKLVA
jgi:hypothetical protein